jgi:hypothetical protein
MIANFYIVMGIMFFLTNFLFKIWYKYITCILQKRNKMNHMLES